MKATRNRKLVAAAEPQKNRPFFAKDGGNDFFAAGRQTGPFFPKTGGVLQAKLTVGRPDDVYEKEADSVADKVMSHLGEPEVQKKGAADAEVQKKGGAGSERADIQRPDGPIAIQRVAETAVTPASTADTVQKKCEQCEKEEQLQEENGPMERLQKKPIFESNAEPPEDEHTIRRSGTKAPSTTPSTTGGTAAPPAVAPTVEGALSDSKGRGSPLPSGTKEQMQSSFGTDLSGVRIHTDGNAMQMSKSLEAQAFTHGNDIYFNSGKFDTHSKTGKHLLAHELTHTIQQKGGLSRYPERGQNGLIQRRPHTPSHSKVEDAIINIRADINIWNDIGLIGISLQGEPWIQIRYTDTNDGQPDFGVGTSTLPQAVSLDISAKQDIDITINAQVEERYAKPRLGGALFKYEFRKNGHRVTVNRHLIQRDKDKDKDQKNFEVGDDDKADTIKEIHHYDGQPPPGQPWDPERPIQVPKTPVLPHDLLPFFWLFDNADQMESFIAAWPKWYWITQVTPLGQYQAFHLDETGMQAAAEKIRKQDEPGFSTMYINGVPKDAWLIYDMFYSWGPMAQLGSTGDTPECWVFRHGDHSFGRSSLQHVVAMADWASLDKKSVADAQGMRIGDYPFEALYVKGVSGSIYEIGIPYLQARDELFAATYKKRREDSDSDMPFSSSFGWDDVLSNHLWYQYLLKAMDRPEGTVPEDLNRLLYSNEGLGDEAGSKLLSQVERDAKMEGELAIEGAIMGLSNYVTEAGATLLAQQMIFMKGNELDQTLEFVGVPPATRTLWKTVFSVETLAIRVWMGETILGVSTALMAEQADKQLTDMKNFKSKIQSDDASPLFMGGDFGNRIREVVYKKYSIDLAPQDFPHEDASSGAPTVGVGVKGFERSAATGLFARAAAKDAKRKRRIKIFELVAASVALMLLAVAGGIVVAGLFIAPAATGVLGLVGFTIEVSVSATIVTFGSPAVQTFVMSDGKATFEDYEKAYSEAHLGRDFAFNLATFGFFKVLGLATRALVVAGAGGKEAFEASRAWQLANAGLRIVSAGGTQIGIGILMQKKIPKGAAMNDLLFETALSVVLMEVGSYALKGPMKSLQNWADDLRLGEFKPRINKLIEDANALRVESVNFIVNRNLAKETGGPELLARQRELLTSQKQLVEEMSQSFRTRPDAKQLDAQFKKAIGQYEVLIQQLQDAEFFVKAGVRPVGRATEEKAVFSYERGKEKEIIDYYGKDNVKEIDGGLEATRDGQKRIFRPSTGLDPTVRPDGTREAQVLDDWRSSLARRRLALLEKAFQLAATGKDIGEIKGSDPSSMKDEELAKLEQRINKVEKALAKTGLKKAPVDIKNVARQPGESTETWRLRLVDIKNDVIQRGKLLGFEAATSDLSKMPTGRSDLLAETLARHAELIKAADAHLTAEWGRQFANEQAKQPAAAGKDIADLKTNLKARQEEVKRRAAQFGSSDTNYVREAKRRIPKGDSLSDLREREAGVEKAEAQLDKYAAQALKEGIAKFGKATIDEARRGELAGMSDQQVGDVLRMLKGAERLTPAALRGALYASLKPPTGSTAASRVALQRIVDFARSANELNFVLESYLALNEAGVEGAYQLMRDASNTADFWKGAVWQLEVIRNRIGIQRVRGVEVKTPGREIDILTTDGQRIETKDWNSWDPEKVQKQFGADLKGATSEGTNPERMNDILWMFRNPPPVSLSEIRATMKTALEDFISARVKNKTMSDRQAQLLRDAFNKHADLVTAPKIEAIPVTMPKAPAPVVSPMPPINKQKNKDDK